MPAVSVSITAVACGDNLSNIRMSSMFVGISSVEYYSGSCISHHCSEIERRSLQARMKDRIALDGVNPSVLHNCSNSAFSAVLTFAEMAVMSSVGICYHSLKFGLPR
jgi:hypothetical protein